MDFSQIIKEQREELEEIEQRERIIGREGLEIKNGNYLQTG